jgi:hypothetical protein
MASQYMGGTSPRSNLSSYYKLASGIPSGALAGGPASYRGATSAQPRAGLPAPRQPGLNPTGNALTQLAQAANAAANPPKPPPDRYQGVGQIDYSSDPVLAQIRLLGQEAVPDATANADAARKQLLIAYGDPNLARSAVFGGKGFHLPGIAGGPDISMADTSHTGDESTALAAQQNPFSTLAKLADAHKLTQHDMNEALNTQGLYYSGERVRQLGMEDKNYQGQQADAAGQAQSALADISGQLMAAYQAEEARQQQAEIDAYLRALGQATGVAPPAPPAPPDPQFHGGGDVVTAPSSPQPFRPNPTPVSAQAATAVGSIPILGAIANLALAAKPKKIPLNSRPGGRGGV